jgi:hypothetical protein
MACGEERLHFGAWTRRNTDVVMDSRNCTKCPVGADCSKRHQELETVSLLPGYWRVASDSFDIRYCPTVNVCIGGNVVGLRGSGYCAPNHEGPYCSVCSAGSASQGGQCVSCDEIQGKSEGLIFLIVALSVCILAYFANRYVSAFRKLTQKLHGRSLLVMLKHMATFFQVTHGLRSGCSSCLLLSKLCVFVSVPPQIVLLLPSVYLVPYPTKYISFLRIFAFVNINIVQIFSLGCIDGWDFHTGFAFAVALPVCIGVLLAICAVAHNAISGRDAEGRMKIWRKAFRLFLILLWCDVRFVVCKYISATALPLSLFHSKVYFPSDLQSHLRDLLVREIR